MVRPRVLALATQGAGGDDEARLRALLEHCDAQFFPFDRNAKWASFRGLLARIRAERPDLVVMEGTGWAGGLALMLARRFGGPPYVVSSGDAVGPFVAARAGALLGWLFERYERRLCRSAAGYIGWTPYLAGRALTFGAPRVMTAAGWAPHEITSEHRAAARAEVRARLGVPADALVIGIVGSINWNRRRGYAYGLELTNALRRVRRADAHAVIVGDGDGRARLEALAVPRVHSTGRVPRDRVPDYLAAFDLASLPQSLDGLGSFRYTTKLSEYLAAGLPIVTGPIPLAYDLDDGWICRLAARDPWDESYAKALAALLDAMTADSLAALKNAVPRDPPEFDRERQVQRVTAFLRDIILQRD